MIKAPMGWNSYDYYDTTVTEKDIKANAGYMADNLKSSGWEYIVVDIEWYSKDAGTQRENYQYIPFGEIEMDEFGRLQPAVCRFPSSSGGRGFAPLAEYVHELGLKFGIHIMRGIPREAAHKHLPIYGTEYFANQVADPSSICKWNPDMYGVRENTPGAQEYYDSIISMYAAWGVDFIKCDDICNTNMYVDHPYSGRHEIEMIHKAIQKSGREIVLSLSPGPALIEQAWHYEKYANMWRITDDFWDNWDTLRNMFDRCELWHKHVAENAYPDCDMLPLGWLGKGFGEERTTRFTKEEQKTMLTLWCIFGSPLMIGAELTRLDQWTYQLLTNTDVLRLTENGYIRTQHEKNERYAVWSCRKENEEEYHIAFFNFLDTEQEIEYQMSEKENLIAEKAMELWDKEVIKIDNNVIRSTVAGHGTKIFRL